MSESGIYHVMHRGIDRQMIFIDSEDEEKFLQLLRSYKKRCGFALYAYCLMGNHIHLLIREAARPSVITVNGIDIETGPGEQLEQVFKRIGVSYVTYFNRKYKRVGHLFQDRYRSEPVDNDAYFLMALRYIHRNPIKAGLCTKPEEYQKSSYGDYLVGAEGSLTDTAFALGMMSRGQFIEYTNRDNEDRFIDVTDEDDLPKTDEEARSLLRMISDCSSASEFQKLGKPEREEYMRQLYKDGVKIAQIGRITGYSRQIVYRALDT